MIVGPPEGVAGRLDLARLRRRGTELLRELGRPRDELVLSLVDDAGIRQLNAEYRGSKRATISKTGSYSSLFILEGAALIETWLSHKKSLTGGFAQRWRQGYMLSDCSPSCIYLTNFHPCLSAFKSVWPAYWS